MTDDDLGPGPCRQCKTLEAKISQVEITLRGKTAESDRWYRLYCEQGKKIKELELALRIARSGV